MKPVYMPFTYLTEPTARILSAFIGPMVVYQPVETHVDDSLTSLADKELIEIRSPLTGDEQRLAAALAEFTQWAGQNPGRSTPGAGFVSSQQGKVPFFDESAINRIRSEIKHYGTPPAGTDAEETEFSARLFLAVAEKNDRSTANLDQDLQQFKTMEQGFLDSLVDSDEAGFSRQALGSQIWQEDPGAKHTEQRIRAWATLAAADSDLPDFLVTTSPAVMDTLMESRKEALHLEQLATIWLPAASVAQPPALVQVLADLAAQQSLTADDCDAFTGLAPDVPGVPSVGVTLYAAMNCPLATVIRQMAPAAVNVPEGNAIQKSAHHTLFVLVKTESKSD